MEVPTNKQYLLGNCQFELDTRQIIRNGQPIPLANKPFQVLLYLIEHRERLVSRTELLDHFWDGKDVYDDALRKCVGAIRKALDDHSESPRFIETRWAGGYRYIGPLEEQLVLSVLEVEKTRGVRLIVEEQEIHDSAPAAIRATVVPSPSRTPRSSGRPFSRALVAVIAIIALAGIGVMIYRSRGKPTTNTTPSPSSSLHSIAVLPLKNLTGDAANDYICDGITESLINTLSRVGALKVISRGSVFAFKGKDADPHDVGKKLGVATVLEGSVQKRLAACAFRCGW